MARKLVVPVSSVTSYCYILVVLRFHRVTWKHAFPKWIYHYRTSDNLIHILEASLDVPLQPAQPPEPTGLNFERQVRDVLYRAKRAVLRFNSVHDLGAL